MGSDPFYANACGITSAITVQLGTGGSIGAYSTGSVISANTSIQSILNSILQKRIPATYVAPAASLSGVSSQEIGTAITLSLAGTFVQNDAGALTATRFYRAASQIGTSNPLSYGTGRLDTGDTFSVQFDYNQGPLKNDNLGDASPTGRIAAGTITASQTLSVYRRAFYAADTITSAAGTSAAVRGLASSLNSPGDGTTFTITIPAGTRRVTIAYPSSLRDLTSVSYVEAGNAQVKDTFILTTVSVDGATAGQNSTNYKVYTYIPSIAYGSEATYNVTI